MNDLTPDEIELALAQFKERREFDRASEEVTNIVWEALHDTLLTGDPEAVRSGVNFIAQAVNEWADYRYEVWLNEQIEADCPCEEGRD